MKEKEVYMKDEINPFIGNPLTLPMSKARGFSNFFIYLLDYIAIQIYNVIKIKKGKHNDEDERTDRKRH